MAAPRGRPAPPRPLHSLGAILAAAPWRALRLARRLSAPRAGPLVRVGAVGPRPLRLALLVPLSPPGGMPHRENHRGGLGALAPSAVADRGTPRRLQKIGPSAPRSGALAPATVLAGASAGPPLSRAGASPPRRCCGRRGLLTRVARSTRQGCWGRPNSALGVACPWSVVLVSQDNSDLKQHFCVDRNHH